MTKILKKVERRFSKGKKIHFKIDFWPVPLYARKSYFSRNPPNSISVSSDSDAWPIWLLQGNWIWVKKNIFKVLSFFQSFSLVTSPTSRFFPEPTRKARTMNRPGGLRLLRGTNLRDLRLDFSLWELKCRFVNKVNFSN